MPMACWHGATGDNPFRFHLRIRLQLTDRSTFPKLTDTDAPHSGVAIVSSILSRHGPLIAAAF